MFWLRNKKNNFQLSTLIWGPVVVRKPDFVACKQQKYSPFDQRLCYSCHMQNFKIQIVSIAGQFDLSITSLQIQNTSFLAMMPILYTGTG